MIGGEYEYTNNTYLKLIELKKTLFQIMLIIRNLLNLKIKIRNL